ncbi:MULTISPECIES: flagellar export protein FliJ [Bacillales]|uniref:Flagellar FliJ protein n=1 Tax=Lysinibacillus louembei TaxID=1470088 RepID=A0ABZ0S0T8_9BACI|nr:MULTISPECIES: flagellar export protein FliJ [Bacillales]MCT6923547.1 flagellar export protein FliJ [Metasolibacillus sp.]MCT6939730.1 flagellar export protein FliJ [Metasolibacillus sp.]WPK14025.1 flagellar export protein FliJ [Lysinibacillus louembei]
MMQYTYRFEKILVVREQEKNESEIAYKESVRVFEEIATKLYDLLKKKEDLLVYQQERLSIGASIDEISHYANFIDSMEKTIADVQQKVVQARSKMNWHEQKLLEKNLEVRKFEKMREKDFDAFREEQNRIEAKQLDELSSLAYNKREIR